VRGGYSYRNAASGSTQSLARELRYDLRRLRAQSHADADLLRAPRARIVELPWTNHYVFFLNEAQVMREISLFIAGLSARN
jgi:hypothetical protein